jgi:predicted extracellular nuclease
MRFLTFLFLSILSLTYSFAYAQDSYRLVFWNVENLFDTQDDSTRNDDDFTPQGQYHWTENRYRSKQNHLAQTIIAVGENTGGALQMPLVVGLAEVENDKVLRDLCRGTSLRNFRYDAVHYDSPDRRGIDNALLYRSTLFQPFFSRNICVSDSSQNFYTRDILLVEGATNQGDTLVILVNHFPSKRSSDNDRWRFSVAKRLRYIMDTVAAAHPSAAIIAMGDFNVAPDEPEIRNALMRNNDGRFINLMADSDQRGSYNYQGYWSFLDQIIVSHNLAVADTVCPLRLRSERGRAFDAGFLLIDDGKNLSQKTFRTYLGIRYLGGYSDHLPVYIDLERRK